MFLDEVPPDTSVYMIAGYTIFFLITAIYLVSLFMRTRNLHRDLDTLENLESEPELPAPEVAPSPAPRKAKASPAKSRRTAPARKKTSRKK